MRRFAGDLFKGAELTPADKQAIVHAFDVDDTLTRKPEGFDNTGLTKDQFFDAARDFPADEAVVELAQLLASKGCLLYTSPSPRDVEESRMPSSA